MKLADGQTLVCTGDSITDCGRARPLGRRGELGGGYVSMLNALIEAQYPERLVRVLNTGISGNRVIDLEARWDSDVLALKPDWVSILIGINDVWRHFDSPLEPRQVAPGEFEAVYRRLIERTLPRVRGLVLMTPYFLEASRKDPMRRMMDAYGAVVKKLARAYRLPLADVQAAFDAYLAHRPTQMLCGDRVHPNATGHMRIAQCLLDAVGFTWKPRG